MLSSYCVLDLTDERGQLAGMILAQLGADVIAVEPPGGTGSRRIGPFHHDAADDPERSLVHWAWNRGKRSVVLDLGDAADRARLGDLAAGADVLLESFGPGHMAGLGLGPDVLAALNPALVQVSISAFGASGPKAAWAASDLTVAAASGHMALTGDPERAPLRISLPPQAWLQAAAEAAGAALLALTERRRSGLGQHVDVPAQLAMMASTQAYMLATLYHATPVKRAGGGANTGTTTVKLVWECADGHVSLTLLFGASLGPFARRLFDWMLEEGACTQADRDTDWINLGMQIHTGEVPVSEWERLKDVVQAFLLTKTKAELLQVALERKLLFAPLATPGELCEREQLAVRGYWQEVEHPALGETIRYPGSFTKLSETPLAPLGPPPTIGQHTAEVLAESARRPSVHRSAPWAAPLSPFVDGPDPRPLAGLKVVDLMWAVAGPTSTRTLADFGATVVRIETESSVDGSRTVGPFLNEEPGPDNTGIFQNMNAGKLGLALDLGRPEAREVVRDLVRWADVITESFSPGAMARWGLDYASLREVNPDIIMVSSCLMGQYGPLAHYAGFGTMAAAICGFHHMTGWPDLAPVGPFSAYTDYVAPRFTVAALLAALDHRDRTGQGQHLDFSQAEASLHLLAPALLDYHVNGRVRERQGNDDDRFAPHGVYPCAGDDRWVAIACETDDQWQALAAELALDPALSTDPALATAAGRLSRRRELDDAIAASTSGCPPADVEARLQRKGIPAHQVQNAPECTVDPQLEHLGHFVSVPHTVHGSHWVEGPRFRLSRTPGFVARGAPMVGEHAWEVLSGMLGYDPDRIADLAAAELLN